jgi:SOS-response transcriptional repressor LexA
MAAMSVVETSRAEYVVLEAAVAGREPQPVGVALHDSGSNRIGFRFRRDWESVADPDDARVLELLADDMAAKAREMEPESLLGWMEDCLSNAIRIGDRVPVMLHRFESTLRMVYEDHVRPRVLPFRTHLPVYSCRAAAGRWGDQAVVEAEPEGWVEAPEGVRLGRDMFVAQVVGRSMEPLIPDGSLCVFRSGVAGSRAGRRVLVENFAESEAGGQRYTVKRWTSEKRIDEEGWSHARIRLEPLNPDFDAWELEEGSECRVVGEFVCVLD